MRETLKQRALWREQRFPPCHLDCIQLVTVQGLLKPEGSGREVLLHFVHIGDIWWAFKRTKGYLASGLRNSDLIGQSVWASVSVKYILGDSQRCTDLRSITIRRMDLNSVWNQQYIDNLASTLMWSWESQCYLRLIAPLMRKNKTQKHKCATLALKKEHLHSISPVSLSIKAARTVMRQRLS